MAESLPLGLGHAAIAGLYEQRKSRGLEDPVPRRVIRSSAGMKIGKLHEWENREKKRLITEARQELARTKEAERAEVERLLLESDYKIQKAGAEERSWSLPIKRRKTSDEEDELDRISKRASPGPDATVTQQLTQQQRGQTMSGRQQRMTALQRQQQVDALISMDQEERQRILAAESEKSEDEERQKSLLEEKIKRLKAFETEVLMREGAIPKSEKARKRDKLHDPWSDAGLREPLMKIARRSGSPDLNVRYTLSQDRSDGCEKSLLLCALAAERTHLFDNAKALRSISSPKPAYVDLVVSKPSSKSNERQKKRVHRDLDIDTPSPIETSSPRRKYRAETTADAQYLSKARPSSDNLANDDDSHDRWDFQDIPSRSKAERDAYRTSVRERGPQVQTTTFRCQFCQRHAVNVRMDKLMMIGELRCGKCLQTFQSKIDFLSAPVDIYSEWIDACNKAAAADELLKRPLAESMIDSGK